MFKFWVSTCFLLSCASGYSATTLRVGSDQSYKTIGAAISAAEANDTVSIDRGNYTETLLIDKPLTLKGNTAELPVLVGHIIVKADNVQISELEISGWGETDPTADGITQERHNGLTVTGCKIHTGSGTGAPIDIGGARRAIVGGSAAGIRVRNSTKTTISNNDIYGCIKGIKIQSSHSLDGTYANGTIIANNKIHDCPVDGVNIQGQYITIEDCMVYDNIDLNFAKTHPDGIQFIAAKNTDGYYAVQHARVLRNTVSNHTQNIFVEGTSHGESSNCEDVLIANNVCYNVPDATVHGQKMSALPGGGIGIAAGSMNGGWIYNNTVLNVRRGIGIGDNKNGSVHIANNIIIGTGVAMRITDPNDLAAGELDHNIYFKNGKVMHWEKKFYTTLAEFHGAGSGQDAHSMEADPKLNPLPAPSLQSGSAAAGAGINLAQMFDTDRTGAVRSRKGPWDIGAFKSAEVSTRR